MRRCDALSCIRRIRFLLRIWVKKQGQGFDPWPDPTRPDPNCWPGDPVTRDPETRFHLCADLRQLLARAEPDAFCLVGVQLYLVRRHPSSCVGDARKVTTIVAVCWSGTSQLTYVYMSSANTWMRRPTATLITWQSVQDEQQRIFMSGESHCFWRPTQPSDIVNESAAQL